MPLTNDRLAQYPRARVLGISVIQVECPECNHLCRSLGKPDPEISSSDLVPLISRSQEMDLVECLNCHKQF